MSMPTGPNPYLKTKIMTASSEELRLMLFDGAIKFAKQAEAALERSDFEASYNNLTRAQKIVLELSTSLNHKVEPSLTEKMSALYTYVYKRLVDANMKRETEPVQEAIKLLTFERETWAMLIDKVRTEGQDVPGGPSGPGGQAMQPTPAPAMATRSPYGAPTGPQGPGFQAYSQSA